MKAAINAKKRLAPLRKVAKKVRRGIGFDPLYRAKAVGHSADSRLAADHDAVLYGK